METDELIHNACFDIMKAFSLNWIKKRQLYQPTFKLIMVALEQCVTIAQI